MKNDIVIRKLRADDIFTLCDILGKCGIREFKDCIISTENNENSYKAGVNIVFEIAGIVCKNIRLCENEIFSFLSDLSGISETELRDMSPSEFIRLVKKVFGNKEMTDFFTAVSEFFISD